MLTSGVVSCSAESLTFFLHGKKTVIGGIYFDMLELFAMPQLQDLQPNIWFQQNGAPPRWSTDVLLTWQNFSNRWVGQDDPIPWLPRCPEITPLDFFLWGYLKDIIHRRKFTDIADLKTRITEAFATVTNVMLQFIYQEIDYRLNVLQATRGAHVEALI